MSAIFPSSLFMFIFFPKVSNVLTHVNFKSHGLQVRH